MTTITKPNQKGQIVIPKTMRDKLHITKDVPLSIVMRGGGIYVSPLSDIGGTAESKDAYAKILHKTKGTWAESWDTLEKKRRILELAASKRRKHLW